MKVKISKIKELLAAGKRVRVRSLGDEYVEVLKYVEKGILPTYRILLKDQRHIDVTAEHRVFTNAGWKRTHELVPGETLVLCDTNEYVCVDSVTHIGLRPIVDIAVKSEKQCYFGNGILNHNTGKSFLAAQIAANAQKKGFSVVYFDSEGAVDPSFLQRTGCELDGDNGLIYVTAETIEMVLKTIESLVGIANGRQFIFIWDSLANTVSEKESESDEFNPQQFVAVTPRVLSVGFKKLTIPILKGGHILLILNQLKTVIPKDPAEAMLVKSEPYFTPGGKSPTYSYSLRIWLTRRKAKSAQVTDEDENRVGCEVQALIKKNRFGSEGRRAYFDLMWGKGMTEINDATAWFEILQKGGHIQKTGNRWQVEGTDRAFFEKNWQKELEDGAFRQQVEKLVEYELIEKFAQKNPVGLAVCEPCDVEEDESEK